MENDMVANVGLLINAKNGQEYKIENDQEFSIGRFLRSSIVLDASYISRQHCTIKFQNNKFIIFDNNSYSGTYLNFEKLGKGIYYYKELNEGDLVTFGECNNMEYIFKFSLASNVLLHKQMNDEADLKYKQMVESSQQSLKILFDKVVNLKAEKVEMENMFKEQFTKFQESLILFEDAFKNRFAKTSSRDAKTIKTLTQNCENLESRISTLEDEYKNQVHNILENDLQCSICNEIIVKIHTAKCNHSFCECCIKQWLSKNQICPICRTRIKDTYNSLAVDNLITNLCNLIGGTVKEQRDNLVKERKEIEEPPKRRGRGGRQRRQENMVGLPRIRNRVEFMPYPVIRETPIVEIVDLTNMSR